MWWPPCNGCGRTSLHQTERNDKKLNTSHPGDKKLITGIFLFIEQIVPELYIILIKGKHTGEDAAAPHASAEKGTGGAAVNRKERISMYYSSGNYEAFARPKKPEGVDNKSAYIVGSGLAALTAACYLVFHTQIGVGNRLDGGRRRVKKYLWSFLRTAPAGQVRL